MNNPNEQGSWRKDVAPYERSHTKRSVWQIINTIIPYIILWYAAYLCLEVSFWLTLPIAIVAGGFLIRTFIIFHDCCHGSFFKNRKANAIVGTITGIMTFVPFQQWRYTHAVHHATSGNLDHRGTGDIWTMTVEEYLSASTMQRFIYRLYRNPIIMFGLGPIYIFLINYRFNRKAAKRKERINTYVTNLGIVVLLGTLCLVLGWQEALLVQVPIFLTSSIAGIWLFYVQHNFEEGYYEEDGNWDHASAALQGSSFYSLPRFLHWITGNIGYHHIHHLSPRVPNYYLEKVHNTNAKLREVQTITLKTSLKSLKFRIWDTKVKRFISFKDIKRYTPKRES
ncbi:fatty acid desaturase [Paenibacillus albiflavus]|uniref:Fatty acid desaturase n=1 Tax=Paenibacillus albiflavus TaxID=2545760 RepID=A0A4R4EF79_9BACL|nr:fatty acid desaturase [Paenibacillus albiflavus]TCZ78716.1 fatty acid desaturase [Paenibacillus albiflavus]